MSCRGHSTPAYARSCRALWSLHCCCRVTGLLKSLQQVAAASVLNGAVILDAQLRLYLFLACVAIPAACCSLGDTAGSGRGGMHAFDQ
jgi:hypothetical protein